MLNSHQIRAARALLRWSAQELADKACLGISTVQRMEGADNIPSASANNLDAVQKTLEAAGIVFLPDGANIDGGPGVRLKRNALDQ